MNEKQILAQARKYSKDKNKQLAFVKGVQFMAQHLENVVNTMDGGEAIDEIIRLSELANIDFVEDILDY